MKDSDLARAGARFPRDGPIPLCPTCGGPSGVLGNRAWLCRCDNARRTMQFEQPSGLVVRRTWWRRLRDWFLRTDARGPFFP